MKVTLVMEYHHNLYDTIINLKKRHEVTLLTKKRVRPVPREIPHRIVGGFWDTVRGIKGSDLVITKHLEKNLLVVLACRMLGIRHEVRVQRFPPLRDFWMRVLRMVHGRNIGIICATKEESRWFRNVRYVPANVNVNRFKEKVYAEDGKFRLLCVSKYLRRKNHKLLAAALNQLVLKHPDIEFELTCIGTIQDVEVHRYMVNAARCLPIKVLSDIPHQAMFAFYGTADLLVFPASSEILGYSLVEGMAAGLPVVCSEEVGAKDYLGENGYIFKVNNAESIVMAVERFIFDGKINRFNLRRVGKE